MLHQYLRLLKYNGTTFTDLSLDNQDESASVSMELQPTDYLYIGQIYPFNNFFYRALDVNTVAANMTIEYWAGNGIGWTSVFDILDGTVSAGVPFAKSGVIQFSPNRRISWLNIEDTSEAYSPSEMQTLRIYNLFWIRLKVDTSLTPPAAVPPLVTPDPASAKCISYAFTTTDQLNNLDVEIGGFYDSFGTSKTDWIDEIVTSSKLMIADFRRMGIVQTYGQLLRFDDVSMACVFKTLWLIYSNLGKAYVDKAKWANDQYLKCLSAERFTVDKDGDATADTDESYGTIKKLVR